MVVKNLHHNLKFLTDQQIIVINDDPTTSVAAKFKAFSDIKLIENSTNLGFGEAVNQGVNQTDGNYILLLNSDVILRNQSYLSAIKHFEQNPDIFAVSFAQLENEQKIVGKNRFYWAEGFFQHASAPNLSYGITGWAEGGSCLLDKQKFINLGGFDNIYSPFYWEDVDLSYRAWKNGYKVLFDPEILVEHHHQSTIRSYFDSIHIEKIAFRNQLLFIAKNIQDQDLVNDFKKHVYGYVLKNWLKGKWHVVIGFFAAQKILSQQPKTQKKNTSSPFLTRTDKEILQMFK